MLERAWPSAAARRRPRRAVAVFAREAADAHAMAASGLARRADSPAEQLDAAVVAHVLSFAPVAAVRAAACTCRAWRAGARLDAAWAGRAAAAFGGEGALALAGVNEARDGARAAYAALAAHPMRDLLESTARARRRAARRSPDMLITLHERLASMPENDSDEDDDARTVRTMNRVSMVSVELGDARVQPTWEGLLIPLPSPYAASYEASYVDAADGDVMGWVTGQGGAGAAMRPCHMCWYAARQLHALASRTELPAIAATRRAERVYRACLACGARADTCCSARAEGVVVSRDSAAGGARTLQRAFVYHARGTAEWRLGFLMPLVGLTGAQQEHQQGGGGGDTQVATGAGVGAGVGAGAGAHATARFTAFLVFTKVDLTTGEFDQMALPQELGACGPPTVPADNRSGRPRVASTCSDFRFTGQATRVHDFFGVRMGHALRCRAMVSLAVTCRRGAGAGAGTAGRAGVDKERPRLMLHSDVVELRLASSGKAVGASRLVADDFPVYAPAADWPATAAISRMESFEGKASIAVGHTLRLSIPVQAPDGKG